MSEHAWKAWETCLECQRAGETCLECQRVWETCLECLGIIHQFHPRHHKKFCPHVGSNDVLKLDLFLTFQTYQLFDQARIVLSFFLPMVSFLFQEFQEKLDQHVLSHRHPASFWAKFWELFVFVCSGSQTTNTQFPFCFPEIWPHVQFPLMSVSYTHYYCAKLGF